MEEEYRMQKAQTEIKSAPNSAKPNGPVIHEDGTVDDGASTRGIMSPPTPEPAIPTIKISGDETEGAKQDEPEPDEGDIVATPLHNGGPNGVEMQKPVQAAGDDKQDDITNVPQAEPFSFSNKRLCERWLDNLFMVLYEDLRVWTIFRAEVAHFKTQHVAYRKTGLEWEILGDLGLRLHHKEEAKEAFQRCLDSPRYSSKPWLKLMEMYSEEGDITRTIQTAIRCAAYAYADYTEMTYPTTIARAFFKLGQIHGFQKISFTLISMGLPDPILKIMESYLNHGKVFKVEGYDF
ncbi:hypothetical protein NMY22_g207 [Coprinellus aureogranulatus]|nr:hypothetical protein NMY22_g207 [Coprinellus aureogranulatus]